MPIGNAPGNMLAAGGAASQPSAQGAALQPPGQGGFNVAAHVEQNWQQAQAQHKQLLAAQKRMDVARGELDQLRKLGDQVQVEDVIKGAGTMVGAGFSPQALAQMLAQMPTTGGEALQAWVEQQDQRAQMMDGQLKQKVTSSAIHRGISAMASLHMDHIKGGQQAMPGPPQGGGPGMGGALAPQQGEDQASAPAEAGAED